MAHFSSLAASSSANRLRSAAASRRCAWLGALVFVVECGVTSIHSRRAGGFPLLLGLDFVVPAARSRMAQLQKVAEWGLLQFAQ